MKRILGSILLSVLFASAICNQAFAARVAKDIPLNACIILDNYDPKAAAYVLETRDKLINARGPGFLSAVEVGSLDEADLCDVAIRIGQPGSWSVSSEIISTQTRHLF